MIRIGTRKSALALWQAHQVKHQLEALGHPCSLVPIESTGDQNLTQPLYSMGIQGVFTKTLDTALLNDQIDIAVHSLKDVPTQLPEGIAITAQLERGSAKDVMIYSSHFKGWEKEARIGSGSLRRKAQWLRKHPSHSVENLRGNLQKRMEKLEQSQWSGAIFALAGLERLALLKENFEVLDWMIPAPAQGIVGIASLEKNTSLNHVLQKIHSEKTAYCAHLERTFLSTLEGGCTAPIGAHAYWEGDQLYFKGGLFSLDGKTAIVVEEQLPNNNANDLGIKTAHKILSHGGKELMQQIKAQL